MLEISGIPTAFPAPRVIPVFGQLGPLQESFAEIIWQAKAAIAALSLGSAWLGWCLPGVEVAGSRGWGHLAGVPPVLGGGAVWVGRHPDWGPHGAAAARGGTSEARRFWKPRGTGWSSLLAPERTSRLEQLQVWSLQQTSAAHLWGWEPAELSIPLPVAICSCRQVAARITHVLCVSEELGCKSSNPLPRLSLAMREHRKTASPVLERQTCIL